MEKTSLKIFKVQNLMLKKISKKFGIKLIGINVICEVPFYK